MRFLRSFWGTMHVLCTYYAVNLSLKIALQMTSSPYHLWRCLWSWWRCGVEWCHIWIEGVLEKSSLDLAIGKIVRASMPRWWKLDKIMPWFCVENWAEYDRKFRDNFGKKIYKQRACVWAFYVGGWHFIFFVVDENIGNVFWGGGKMNGRATFDLSFRYNDRHVILRRHIDRIYHSWSCLVAYKNELAG